VHLVGFIIRIYHDARSPESQIKNTCNYIPTSFCMLSCFVCGQISVFNRKGWDAYIQFCNLNYKFHVNDPLRWCANLKLFIIVR